MALSFDLEKIPVIGMNDWRPGARPYVARLVQAFESQGIARPAVCAYACASISRESSWNPKAENKSDPAAHTGYPGRGLAQITWRDNYAQVGAATGIDFLGNPDLMFDPDNALRAKAAFFKLKGMLPYIDAGNFESAAGIYNTGRPTTRSKYTLNVANDTPRWLPVFSEPVAPSAAVAAANAPVPGGVTRTVYVVQSGDSLSRIARRNNLSLKALLALNPQIPDPNAISIGQQVFVS